MSYLGLEVLRHGLTRAVLAVFGEFYFLDGDLWAILGAIAAGAGVGGGGSAKYGVWLVSGDGCYA